MTFSSITVALLAGTIILVPTSAYSDVYYARTKELWVQGDQIQIEFGTINECPIVFMALYRYDEFVKLYSFPTSIGLTLTLDSANLEASDGYHAFLWCNTIKEGTTISFRLNFPTSLDPITNSPIGLTYYYSTPDGCKKLVDGQFVQCENFVNPQMNKINLTEELEIQEFSNLTASIKSKQNTAQSENTLMFLGISLLAVGSLLSLFYVKKRGKPNV